MRILASQYNTVTAMKKKKKCGQTIPSCSMRVPYAGLWAVIYSVITRVLIAHAQVRPEQHTLISVFKLNSCKLCQFKHLRARGCEVTRAVRRCVRMLIRSAQTRASECAQIWSSLWCIVWMDKFTQKFCQNARLGNNKEITHCSWLNRFCNFNKD